MRTKNLLRGGFVLLTALFFGVAAWFGVPEFTTSIYDLVGKRHLAVPAPLRDRSAAQIQILFEAKSLDDAIKVADEFHHILSVCGKETFSSIRFRTDDDRLEQVLSFYRQHAAGICSPDDLDKLNAKDFRFFTDRTLQSLFTSPAPPLVPFQEDHFGLLDHYLKSFPNAISGWSRQQGVMAAEFNQRHYVLMSLTLQPEVAADINRLESAVHQLLGIRRCALGSNGEPDTTIHLCGVPMHTAETAGRCRTEINLIAWISTAFILLLALEVFRSFLKLPLLLITLGLSAATGFAAVCIVSRWLGPVHLLACTFGATLLGLAVDYSFHWLMAEERREEIRRKLLLSCLTTEIAFLPLLFSRLPVLTQMAVFMGTGLAAALLFVLAFYPVPQQPTAPRPLPRRRDPRRFRTIFALAVAAILLYGGWRIRFRTDPDSLHRPSRELLVAEKTFQEISGSGASSGFIAVHGDSLDELLEIEERLNLAAELPRLSRFLPSLEKRRAAYRAIEELYRDQSARLSGKLKLKSDLKAPMPPVAWDPEKIPAELADPFICLDPNGGFYSVIPNVLEAPPPTDGVSFFAPRRLLAELMAFYTRTVLWLLAATGLLLVIAVAAAFKKRAFKIALPPVIAVMTVFSLIAITGQPVNLFHLLACFMLIGMSLDYSIFLDHDFERGFKPVLCSLLTSLAGFGTLAFVSFPLVRSLGQTLGIGLAVSFLAACACHAPVPKSTEFGASTLGLESAWLVYRIFGKRALYLLSSAIAGCIWMSSATVRKNAKNRTRMANFTRGLVDQLLVLAKAVDAPKVIVAHPEATEFCSAVETRRGVFVISSHLGNIETLAALGNENTVLHAFMDLRLTSVFQKFSARHSNRSEVEIHPIENFGMRELFITREWLDKGECVLMAGDRYLRGKYLTREFMGLDAKFPAGVFKLAELLDHPVFFAVCLRNADGTYELLAKAADAGRPLLDQYTEFLEPLVQDHPDQWYNW